jgi:hypothetical protein
VRTGLFSGYCSQELADKPSKDGKPLIAAAFVVRLVVKEHRSRIDKMTDIQPILLSAITCGRVIFDKVSGMPSIIDIVQTIDAQKYPARHAQIFFFCELTNGHGTTKTKVRLIDTEEEEKVIFEREGTVKFEDVKRIVTLAVNLQGIVFPHPGEYRFQLLAGGALLGDRRIICRKINLPPKPGQQQPPQG